MASDTPVKLPRREQWARNLYRMAWKLFHRDEIIFYARKPMHYVMFKEIHRQMPEVTIVASRKSTKKYLKSLGIPFRSRTGYPQVVIAPHYLRTTYNIPEIKKITTFHGMAKNVMFDPKNQCFDLFLAMGDYAENRFREMGIDRFRIVGYPKIDRLLTNSIDIDRYRTQLELDPHKKTLLYAPTWGSNGSLEILTPYLNLLGEKYNILVKLHDKSRSAWDPVIASIPGVTLVDDPDIIPYYLLSDALISDYSSVIFEYAVLDRPIILFDVPGAQFNKESIGYQWRDIGERIQGFDQLQTAIEKSLQHPEALSEKRRSYTRQIFRYLDGRSAERAAEAIREFCLAQGYLWIKNNSFSKIDDVGLKL